MYGLTRATVTLIGVAAAAVLLYVASQFAVDETDGEYWAWAGLLAAAGLVIALSQLLGGWTKWGWPRVSASVFLLGFLPALIVGGLVLLHAQPDGGVFGQSWADDLGVDSAAEDLVAVLPAIAFALGLVFGLTFDTTGPRVREVPAEDGRVARRHDERVAEEPLAAERTTTATEYPTREETPSVAAAGAVPEGDGDRPATPTTRTTRDRATETNRD